MYLTKRELQELHAYVNYSPRNLTVLEGLIKELKFITKMATGTDLLREMKRKAKAKVIADITSATGNDKIVDQCKKALVNPDSLENLLESYPYVQFEKLIWTGKINAFQKLYHHAVSPEFLQEASLWLSTFLGIVSELPTHIQCFVQTPDTDNKSIRKYGKKVKATFVRPLQPHKQEILNDLLSPRFSRHLETIVKYRLYNEIPELERRLKVNITKGVSRNDKLYPFYVELFREEYMDFLEVSAHVQTESGDIQSMVYKFAIPQFPNANN